MIHDWLKIPYKDYGRDEKGADCWGLVRLVRHALRGDLLPSYGEIAPMEKAALTDAARDVMAGGFVTTDKPRVGTIATVWRGALCMHVGIVVDVDGRLSVLESGSKIGVRWLRIHDFERVYLTVKYYDNHN